MTHAPKRRWFRFSLRTLFVVVTVIACWLGWSLNWMRDRAEARAWIQEHGYLVPRELVPRPVAAPWGLRLFREQGEFSVGIEAQKVPVNELKPLARKLQRLFPESFVQIRDYDKNKVYRFEE